MHLVGCVPVVSPFTQSPSLADRYIGNNRTSAPGGDLNADAGYAEQAYALASLTLGDRNCACVYCDEPARFAVMPATAG